MRNAVATRPGNGSEPVGGKGGADADNGVEGRDTGGLNCEVVTQV